MNIGVHELRNVILQEQFEECERVRANIGEFDKSKVL